MTREFADRGHLRATVPTAGVLGHLVVLRTSTYHLLAIKAKREALEIAEWGIFEFVVQMWKNG
jgi:hypothetical protein